MCASIARGPRRIATIRSPEQVRLEPVPLILSFTVRDGKIRSDVRGYISDNLSRAFDLGGRNL